MTAPMPEYFCIEAVLFGDNMTYDQLREKAHGLPMEPGVYIMREATNKVIYVGKAKKLRNRVSQYFQDTASHSPKTKLMVSRIHHFDVIIAASEFEALVLECSLIKRYMPKYNILLKDDKGYPYLRLNMKDEYPRITMVSKPGDDQASYYGPYGSRGVTQNILETIIHTLKLPDCSRELPRDIGKSRPCLNYHMNLCGGWCQPDRTKEEYRETAEQARQLLSGNEKSVARQLREQMLEASDALEFERAASLRDRLNAVEALGNKQLVTAGSWVDMDVIGYGQTSAKACFAVLHFSGGNLIDKEYEVFSVPDDAREAVSSLIKQYYLSRGMVPKKILLPFPLEESGLIQKLLEDTYSRKIKIHTPSRGDNARLVELACKNAFEEAQRLTGKEEKVLATLQLLGKMLSMDPPGRIESFDISNISGTDIVAAMVVFENGRPKKSEYKRFKIEDLPGQDDYASMEQTLIRRFSRYVSGDTGFSSMPDLLLIDGGAAHAGVALAVLEQFHLTVPVFGMVKDDKHRTRALITAQGQEIAVDSDPSVFAMIGNIQEETHRFAISYHRKLRSKRLQHSKLDSIPGIGPQRKQVLLKTFRSLSAVSQADIQELERVLPRNAAAAVYYYFHDPKGE